MAKSKSKPSSTAIEKKQTSVVVGQFQDLRSEIAKVTWPTREEARSLSIAVTIGTVVIGFFLFLVDLLFSKVLEGLVTSDVVWIITGVVALVLLSLAFIVNNREV